jgi:hypothetical protein
MMNHSSVAAAFDSLLKDTGIVLKTSTLEVAKYSEQRSLHLSAIAGQPGFDQALAAEVRNVAQFAGIEAAQVGDQTDALTISRIFGLIFGVLAAGA